MLLESIELKLEFAPEIFFQILLRLLTFLYLFCKNVINFCISTGEKPLKMASIWVPSLNDANGYSVSSSALSVGTISFIMLLLVERFFHSSSLEATIFTQVIKSFLAVAAEMLSILCEGT